METLKLLEIQQMSILHPMIVLPRLTVLRMPKKVRALNVYF